MSSGTPYDSWYELSKWKILLTGSLKETTSSDFSIRRRFNPINSPLRNVPFLDKSFNGSKNKQTKIQNLFSFPKFYIPNAYHNVHWIGCIGQIFCYFAMYFRNAIPKSWWHILCRNCPVTF